VIDETSRDLLNEGVVATLPHVYKIAKCALRDLINGTQKSIVSEDIGALRNQSIIVTGESGAGKTEASKRVMAFMIAASESNILSETNTGTRTENFGAKIRDALLDSNLILEAFGNAKTVRNDNSSRFGKYIRLHYSNDDVIVSAYTKTFLLEKSRLSSVSPGERNYHVFYQVRLPDQPNLTTTQSVTPTMSSLAPAWQCCCE
jgi:myosin-5